MHESEQQDTSSCPICYQLFPISQIEEHCNWCIIHQQADESQSCETPVRKKPTPIPLATLSASIEGNVESFPFWTTSKEGRNNFIPINTWSPGKFDFYNYGMTDEEIARQIQEEEWKLYNYLKREKQHQKNGCMTCQCCNNTMHLNDILFMDNCVHVFCKGCIQRYLIQMTERENCIVVNCPFSGCNNTISESTMKQVLNSQEFQNLIDCMAKSALMHDNTCVICPSCKHMFQRVEQDTRQITQKLGQQHLGNGRNATEADICREQHRFLCGNCKIEFCDQCHTTPYHENRTCEQYRAYMEASHCRFCGSIVTSSSKSKHVLNDNSDSNNNINSANEEDYNIICDKEECQIKKQRICTKKLACGHYCCGIRDERECMPCFQGQCARLNGLNHSGGEYCNICFIEVLQEAPCIWLKCGHIFHEHCIRKKLESKWSGARITFGFMNCPLCKQEMDHEAIADLLEPLKHLKAKLLEKCRRRLQFEKPSDVYKMTEKERMEYAYLNFAYYQCYTCHEPYFGGRRQCDMNLGDGNDNFNEKELVCGSCLTKEFGDKQSCPIHATEYLEYKCKFCCNIAVWYCWGSTHFCQSCHDIQCQTQSLTRRSKEELPKCLGPGKCPIGGNHGENGEEYALGCAICRKLAMEDY